MYLSFFILFTDFRRLWHGKPWVPMCLQMPIVFKRPWQSIVWILKDEIAILIITRWILAKTQIHLAHSRALNLLIYFSLIETEISSNRVDYAPALNIRRWAEAIIVEYFERFCDTKKLQSSVRRLLLLRNIWQWSISLD